MRADRSWRLGLVLLAVVGLAAGGCTRPGGPPSPAGRATSSASAASPGGTGAAVSPGATPSTGAAAKAACVRSTAPAERGVFGINLGNQRTNQLAAVPDLGIGWIRADLPWTDVEYRRDSYDWAGVDAAVTELQARGLRAELVINHAPDWARSLGEQDFAAAAARFTAALVARYKPQGTLARAKGWSSYGVSHWEVFNEPNLTGYGWGQRGDDPRKLVGRYATTLATVNRAIRAEDARAMVILAGLSPDQHMPAEEVISAVYAHGAGACFDIAAFHPYGYEGRFAAARDRIRRTLAAHGDPAVPIWFNEYGTNTEADQDRLLRSAHAERGLPDALFWFALTDFNQLDGRYGVLRTDGSRKPGYATMRGLVRGG